MRVPTRVGREVSRHLAEKVGRQRNSCNLTTIVNPDLIGDRIA